MVTCNECKHTFGVKVRTRQCGIDVEEVFFNCPNCHERYTAYYINDKIKYLQSKLKSVRGKEKTTIQRQIKQEMNRLQEIYGTP